MKVYTTKYALTAGIEIKEVADFTTAEKYVYTKAQYRQQFVMGKTAFQTYPEAAKAARAMRIKKQVSLTQQLMRVSGLAFPSKEPTP